MTIFYMGNGVAVEEGGVGGNDITIYLWVISLFFCALLACISSLSMSFYSAFHNTTACQLFSHNYGSHIKTLEKLIGAFLNFGHAFTLSIFEK